MTARKAHHSAAFVLVALLLTAFAPSGAGADSCYPVPDPACPPRQVNVPLLGTVQNPLHGATTSLWPDMQLAIVGNQTFAGAAAFAPGDVTARYGGKLFIQNFTAETHIIAQVINGTPCFTGCPQWNATLVGPVSAGYFAASINIATRRGDGTGFERSTALQPKTYPFACFLHPTTMKGTLTAA